MLQLFNVSWSDLIQKMPEIAEAGYDSLWLPPPAKGSSVFSVGYDQFDPFDLGDKNQAGTIPTRWGTKDQLLQVVETAHRFGLRVYFDNVMNHRAFTVPGFNATTPTNFYPGLLPQDFHLLTSGQYFQNMPWVQDYNNQWDVQNESLSGLVDLATEPGSVNVNFGANIGSTTPKLSFIRHPNNPAYYLDPSGPSLGGPWRPFNGTNGSASADDVNAYLIRAAMWTLWTTKCDGFRLDAVKHVPSDFFGADTGAGTFTNDSSFSGYTGGIQAMYDWTHGYGSNVTGNGYMETDGNRNSLFDTEAPRNDAMLFGEHLGMPPTFSEYLRKGMRLLNAPLRDKMNGTLGNSSASLSGMDQRDYVPYSGAFSAAQAVQFAQSADQSGCCATYRELQDAYYFMHEGIPEIYSDGYNHSQAPPNQSPFPEIPDSNYLGEFADNLMPDLCYVHNQLSRGGTWARWSDSDIVAFERYDYREGNSSNPQDQDVVLFVMNDTENNPHGDILFDDGVYRPIGDGYYGCWEPNTPSRGVGLVVGFPPGSVLSQLSSSSPGGNRACPKLLVHYATQSTNEAFNTVTNSDPVQRKIYVGGQTLAPNGGAIELVVPSGGWVMYGYQWPEPSRASLKDAVTFRQGGGEVPRLTVYRRDGLNGDTNFNPVYPFKMRGSVDQFGNVIAGTNAGTLTYAIDVPVVTNAPFDIVVRNDASSVNTLVKLDGGIDLNSQMGLGPTNGADMRDQKPGYATDVFLGYEQTVFQFRNGPEKFAARVISSNNIVSLGAETYRYTVGGTNFVVAGAGYGQNITNQTATWIYHDPSATNTALAPNNTATQRVPLAPTAGQAADIYVKVGYQFQINACYIYYTTDGTNPEGSFGAGKGTTQVVQAHFLDHDSAQSNIDWWKGTIPAQADMTDLRYKVAVFSGGSPGFYAGTTNYSSIQPISDGEASGSKLYGLTQAAITNFDPTVAKVWLHNDLNTNNTATGLKSGFHIVRARTFLPRNNKSSVYNTFLQTFYYDGALPAGVITSPNADGASISNATYIIVVRADSSVTEVDFNVQDSNPSNDDAVTGQHNGNGLTNGVLSFASSTQVTPDPALSALYPNYPLEFHCSYTAVPNSGTANITVLLKEYATPVYPNRFTTLTRSNLNTLAPTSFVQISNPGTDGTVLTIGPDDIYPIRACFSTNLTSSINNFSVYTNGVMLPRRAANGAPLYSIGGTACGTGMRLLTCSWSGAAPGTNIIQVVYTGSVILSDTRMAIVAPPLVISSLTGITNSTPLLVWQSAPGVNYQVLSATNLSDAFAPISLTIPANGFSTFFYDNSPAASQKFYEIQVVP